ncbi:phage holin family protein [Nesterenkonia sp. NBAIMH1]|uniref:phage holin family protein n=1 Tax=Nesterenkonia sp. NBAIMH1 TaxID=2600320 RepID=UPI001FEF24B9|nr:phage holin family protein [Nesterenkonia sp. NBAIMH1]
MILLNALAVWAATLVPGIWVSGWSQDPLMVVLAYLVVGAVFGVINAVIKPVLSLLALPITCLTLGLFAIVINAAMLMLTGWLVTEFIPGVEFVIDGFLWAGVLGAIVVALVSALLGRFLQPERA